MAKTETVTVVDLHHVAFPQEEEAIVLSFIKSDCRANILDGDSVRVPVANRRDGFKLFHWLDQTLIMILQK